MDMSKDSEAENAPLFHQSFDLLEIKDRTFDTNGYADLHP